MQRGDKRDGLLSSFQIKNLGMIGVLIGSLLSGFTTYSGLRAFCGPEGPNGFLISLGVTTLVQLLLFVSVIRFRQETLRKKLPWLACYLVSVFFSVTFAVSFWVHHLDGDRLAQVSAERPFYDVDVSLNSYVTAYEGILNNLSTLAAHSDSMAYIESEFGNSCGDGAPKGTGPRHDLRREDQQKLNAYASTNSENYRQLQELKEEFRTVKKEFDPQTAKATQASIRDILTRIEVIHNNNSLGPLREYLQDRLNKGAFVYNEAGDEFQCPDPTFETYGSAVLGSINSLPTPPSALNVTLYDGSSARDAVRLTLGVVLGKLGILSDSLIPYSEDVLRDKRIGDMRQARTATPASPDLPVLPIVVGVVVDLLIFLSACAMPKSSKWVDDAENLIGNTGSKLLREYPADPELIEYISRFVLDGRNKKVSLQGLFNRRLHHNGEYVVLARVKTDEDATLLRLMDVFVNARYAKPIYRGTRLYKYLRSLDVIAGKKEPRYVWQLYADPAKVRNALRWIELHNREPRCKPVEEVTAPAYERQPSYRLIPELAKNAFYDLITHGWRLLRPYLLIPLVGVLFFAMILI